MSGVVHIERGDQDMFCGIHVVPAGASVTYRHAVDAQQASSRPRYVSQSAWREEPESIQSGTCPECLARIYMLGDSAAIALGRLGLKIEVRDATEAEANPS